MRVLILGLNFAPELVGVGRCSGEFASWLSRRGHEVRVVTAPPYYPEWRVDPGHTAWRYAWERCGRVEVLRCPIWVPAVPTLLRRVLHLLSFALSSFVPCLWISLRWRPDVIWAVAPTACAAPTALLAARLTGASACLHVQDLEIEAALGLHVLAAPRAGALLRRAYGWVSRRFDLVSTISAAMHARLAGLGVAAERLCLFPNGVDTRSIVPLERPSGLRRALGLTDDAVVALYAGNMGEKQGLEMLATVADHLRALPQIHLVLCGAGAARRDLESRLRGRDNVTLLPLQPAHRLNELLGSADIHLLPQRAGAESFALPSKLGGILASGRPVVAQASVGELFAAARRCGIVVPPGDPAAMADAIAELAADPARRRRLGAEARRFAERHLDCEPILACYTARLVRLAALRPVAGAHAARATPPRPVTGVAVRGASNPATHGRRR